MCRLGNLVHSIVVSMPLFVMNVLQIIPNGEEIVPAVLAFAEELNEDPLKKQ